MAQGAICMSTCYTQVRGGGCDPAARCGAAAGGGGAVGGAAARRRPWGRVADRRLHPHGCAINNWGLMCFIYQLHMSPMLTDFITAPNHCLFNQRQDHVLVRRLRTEL